MGDLTERNRWANQAPVTVDPPPRGREIATVTLTPSTKHFGADVIAVHEFGLQISDGRRYAHVSRNLNELRQYPHQVWGTRARAGDQIESGVPLDKLHVFDPETKQALVG